MKIENKKLSFYKNYKTSSRIEKKLKRKTNEELVETIISAKKKDSWRDLAHKISIPKRKRTDLNLGEINSLSSDDDLIVVPGKVLGMGDIEKKIKISALGYSENAKKKLKQAKIEFNFLKEEIKSNPNAKKMKILERK